MNRFFENSLKSTTLYLKTLARGRGCPEAQVFMIGNIYILHEMNYIILLRIIEFCPFTETADIQHWTIHHSQDCNRIKFKSTSRRKAVVVSPRLLTTIRNRTIFYRYLCSFHHIIDRQVAEISGIIFEIFDSSSIQYRFKISICL